MPVTDYVNFAYMQTKASETMMFGGQRLACVVDHDIFGGEVKMYVPSEKFRCGAFVIRQSDRPNFTGTDVDMDLRARVTPATWKLFGSTDRIRITPPTPEGLSGDYEIAGFGFIGISSVIIELLRADNA